MKYIHLIISIIIAHTAGLVGSLFTMPAVDNWYTTLTKPTWNPPSWVFGPVWLLLYSMMGYAAFLVWEKRHYNRYVQGALILYGVHLVCNALWSIIFFGLQNVQLAFYWILLLDIFILSTFIVFWRIRKSAGILLIPYLVWTLFATYLNYTIWMLN